MPAATGGEAAADASSLAAAVGSVPAGGGLVSAWANSSASGTLQLAVMINTAGQWHGPIGCYVHHRRPLANSRYDCYV